MALLCLNAAVALSIGLDVGTTSAKAVVYAENGEPVGQGRAATPWHGTELDAAELIVAAHAAIEQAVSSAPGAEPIAAIGITGMGESGVLIDAAASPVAPVLAWHDTRDAEDVAALASQFGSEFATRAGKPMRGQWSITKHRWLVRSVPAVRSARRRFNIPEWVARSLGADEVTELSLACRTGWLDLASATWWADALDFSAAAAELMPRLVEAGQPIGVVTAASVPPRLRGAVVTIAGHDHQAAAIGVGATGPGDEFDSCGTAEALIRTLEVAPTPEQIRALAELGVTVDRSVQVGRWSLLGGTEAGLAMRRVLDDLGVGPDGMAALDEAALAGAPGAASWLGAVDAAAAEAAVLHRGMSEIVGPASRIIAAGGWTHSRAYLAAKRAALGDVQVSDVLEAGTRGAAILARQAAGLAGRNA